MAVMTPGEGGERWTLEPVERVIADLRVQGLGTSAAAVEGLAAALTAAEYERDRQARLARAYRKERDRFRDVTEVGKALHRAYEAEARADSLATQLEDSQAALYSGECSCGKRHYPTGMAGTDVVMDEGAPKGPDCRPLTWRDEAERSRAAAIARRKEGKAALAERDALAERLRRANEKWADQRNRAADAEDERDQARSALAELVEAVDRHHSMPDGESWEAAYNEVCELVRIATDRASQVKE